MLCMPTPLQAPPLLHPLLHLPPMPSVDAAAPLGGRLYQPAPAPAPPQCSCSLAVPPALAVFDTAILLEGHLYQLDQHLRRFLTNAARANIPLPPGLSADQMRRTILETAAASCKLNGAAAVPRSSGSGAAGGGSGRRQRAVAAAAGRGVSCGAASRATSRAVGVAAWQCRGVAPCGALYPPLARLSPAACPDTSPQPPPAPQALCATGCRRGAAALG